MGWFTRFNTNLLVLGLISGISIALPAETQKTLSEGSGTSNQGKPAGTNTVPATTTQTKKKTSRRIFSTFLIHVEATDDGTHRYIQVPIDRKSPLKLTIDRNPVLLEEHLKDAAVVDDMGGFVIRIRCNERGTMVLDAMTNDNRGRRLVLFSNFGQDRWLAAPLITKRIRDGVLTFTPDATREEAERIVDGLNNTLAKLKKRSAF